MSKDLKNLFDSAEEGEISNHLIENEKLKEARETISNLVEMNSQLEEKINNLKRYLENEKEKLKKVKSPDYSDRHDFHDRESNIDELEKKKEFLEENNKKLKLQQEYINNLENTNLNYENKISDLTETITDLQNKIKELGQNNEILHKDMKKLKFEKNYLNILERENTNLENRTARLQEKIEKIEQENQKFIEKNQILKAALLLNIEAETKNKTDNIGRLEPQPITSSDIAKARAVSTGKIVEPKEKKISELSSRIERNFEPEKIKAINPHSLLDLEKEKESGLEEKHESRRICPVCSNQNQRFIREMDDKSKLIMAYPRVYGKKFICGQCGAEWR